MPNFKRMLSPQTLRQAGQNAGEYVVAYLSPYAPSSSANTPPAPYYVRGRGTTYASGFNDGSSENMLQRWSVKAGSNVTHVRNTASYSGYVSGLQQTRIHERRGWKSQRKFMKSQKELDGMGRAYLRPILKAGGVK
ncbi:MAG: hypothetical protein AAF902_02025 [Chloroflexota bacterium]